MIKQTPRYQQMERVFECILQLKQELQELPNQQQEEMTPHWEAVELKIETLSHLIEAVQKTEELVEDQFSEADWKMWRTLVKEVQQDQRRAIQLLTVKKNQFYKEVRSIGRSVKASRAYNDMKRIRY